MPCRKKVYFVLQRDLCLKSRKTYISIVPNGLEGIGFVRTTLETY